ncbi:hypothetical protein, partial [Flavobacterium sp. FPG59]|uniref:hypothetical protein n=1 Tax=Flavobacterium sp. FPG59 TaxID=1929267 RepID=UPI000B6790F8
RAKEYGYSSKIFEERFKNVSDLQTSLKKLISVQKAQVIKDKKEKLEKQKIYKAESERKKLMYLIFVGIGVVVFSLVFIIYRKYKHIR